MKVKTSELSGKALDWAVGKAMALNVAVNMDRRVMLIESYAPIKMKPWTPSTNCGQSWPFIEKFKMHLLYVHEDGWNSKAMGVREFLFGKKPMVAICRAVVSAKLGDEVEIPDELMEVKG